MLVRHSRFLDNLDGEVHESWHGLNDTLLQHGKAEISKAFYHALERCARARWKHQRYLHYQEPGSSCVYRVYGLGMRYFVELQSAKLLSKDRGLVIQCCKDAGGYTVALVSTADGQATLAQRVMIQRLDEIFTRLGAQVAIQGFLNAVSVGFTLVEADEAEFDGIPLLYNLVESDTTG